MAYSANPINKNSQYSLSALVAGSNCACTIVTIKNTNAMSAEITTNPNGNRAVPNGASRLVFVVNAPLGTTAGTFTVTQGGSTLHTCTFGEQLLVTFEVI